jgi:heptosyltransferase-2
VRVLFVRFGSLGDVLLTLAAAAALRAARPEARTTYLVKAEFAPLVEGQAGVDEVWPLAGGAARSPAALAGLRRRIAGGGFDVGVDWQTSARSRALLAGLPRVLAWRAARLARRRWVSLRWTRPAPVRPAWLRYLDALAPLGVDPGRAAPPRYRPPAPAGEEAGAFFAAWDAAAGPAPPVALAPGARWATKRWPAAGYAAVAASLRAGGERVLWVGDAGDRARFEHERERAGLGPPADDPGERWFQGSLAATAAVLARARAVAANDSGLLHLGAAVGRPVVALVASTHPALGFAPAGEGHRVLVRDLPCQPCTLHGRERCPLGHHRCARDIAPGEVLAALGAGRLRD